MFRTLQTSRSLAVIFLSLVTLQAADAHARRGDARGDQRPTDPRPLEARKACMAGNVERGIEILAEIIVEKNDPNAVYNQGRCYQQNGRPEEAITRFREYLRIVKNATPAERAEVERFIGELEAEVEKKARRQATGGAKPAPTAPAASAAPIPVTPPMPATPAPAPREENLLGRDAGPRRSVPTASIALASVGVAAIGAGAFFSWRVANTAREIETQRGPVNRADIDRLMDKGRRAETLQWVSYGAGAAALIASATFFFLDRAVPESSVQAMWTGDGAGASFSTRF